MSAKASKSCEICGKDFDYYPSRQRNARFCSVSCKGQYGRSLQDQSGENNPAWKGGVRQKNMRKAVLQWRRDNPEKYRAHRLVHEAVKTGRLIRQPCESCGSVENIDGHHHDYSKPLDVEWLCRKCHQAHHRSEAA